MRIMIFCRTSFENIFRRIEIASLCLGGVGAVRHILWMISSDLWVLSEWSLKRKFQKKKIMEKLFLGGVHNSTTVLLIMESTQVFKGTSTELLHWLTIQLEWSIFVVNTRLRLAFVHIVLIMILQARFYSLFSFID